MFFSAEQTDRDEPTKDIRYEMILSAALPDRLSFDLLKSEKSNLRLHAGINSVCVCVLANDVNVWHRREHRN